MPDASAQVEVGTPKIEASVQQPSPSPQKEYQPARERVATVSSNVLKAFRVLAGRKPASINFERETEDMQELAGELGSLHKKTEASLNGPTTSKDYAPFSRESITHIFENPDKQTYSRVVFKATSPYGDELEPGKRVIYAIPQEYHNRVIRDVVLKHRKDPSLSPGENEHDPQGAYSRLLVKTPAGEWKAWVDPEGYNPDKFAEPRSAGDPESEVLHDWIATVGKVKPTVISVENVGKGEKARSQIHGVEITFFPEVGRVDYTEKILTPGTRFIDPEKGVMLPTYGGGKQGYPEAVVLGGWSQSQQAEIDFDNTKDVYMDRSGRLHIKLEAGKNFVGLELAVGDTHTDGSGQLGWAKLNAGLANRNPGGSVSYFMENANVPPAGVLAGGPNEAEKVIQDGDELIVESLSDTTYLMGYRVAYKK